MKNRVVSLLLILGLILGLGSAVLAAEAESAAAPFRYEHDPRLNPRAMEDIVADPAAVYGFRPSPTGSLKLYADADWSDPQIVEAGRQERIAYHETLESMYAVLEEMDARGCSTEEIARTVSSLRNQIRLDAVSDDPERLEATKARNLEKYGHEEGPLPDELYAQYGSWDTVIEKAFSTNAGMDACLGLYDEYYPLYLASHQMEEERVAPAPREYVIAAFLAAPGVRAEPSGAAALEDFGDAADVSEWYRTDCALAVESGLILGYEDGTLRPRTSIRRVEALVLLSRCLPELEAVREPVSFSDVPGWAREEIDRLSAAGLVEGLGDGTLGAEDALTVEQVRILTDRLAG